MQEYNPGEPWVPLAVVDAEYQVALGDLLRLKSDEEGANTHYRQAFDLVDPFMGDWNITSELWIADSLKNLRMRLIDRLGDLALLNR